MRTHFIMAVLGLASPLGMAIAQPVQDQSDPRPEADSVIDSPAAAPDTVPPSPARSSALPGPSDTAPAPGRDGVIRQWNQPQEIAEAVPPSPKSYPPCTNARQDSCTNPDPRRELPYYPADREG